MNTTSGSERERTLERYRRQFETLVQEAWEMGIILTAETVPLQPLAMGNYVMHTEARYARDAPADEAGWVAWDRFLNAARVRNHNKG